MKRWRPNAPVVGGAVLALALVTSLILLCYRPPGREQLQRLGDGMVAQIERYRSAHGRYPETLRAAGISQPTYHYSGFAYRLIEGGEAFELSIGDYSRNGFCLFWNSKWGVWYHDT